MSSLSRNLKVANIGKGCMDNDQALWIGEGVRGLGLGQPCRGGPKHKKEGDVN